jgi:hypothetical protein
MVFRAALLLVPTVLFALPSSVFAQAPVPAAPPEVEQALRARVTEFFQDFVDGKFRQAINLVAEDTQDAYFSSPKAEYKAFKIEGIDYSDNFGKANVQLTMKQVWKLKAEGFLQDTIVDAPMSTAWKVENGKWVFYQPPAPSDGWVTPMGPSQGFRKPDGSTPIPKKLDEATINQEASRLLHLTGVDKDAVTLRTDVASSAKVVFHNGAQGSVSVALEHLPKAPPGLEVKLSKSDLNADQDAVVEVVYDPAKAEGQAPPTGFYFALDVAPFDQRIVVQVLFAATEK